METRPRNTVEKLLYQEINLLGLFKGAGIGVGVLVLGVVVLVVVNPVCGCGHGRIYREIPLQELPKRVHDVAVSRLPGATLKKAWSMHEDDRFEGYLIRMQSGLLWSEDLRIAPSLAEPTEELEAIEQPKTLNPPRPSPAAGR